MQLFAEVRVDRVHKPDTLTTRSNEMMNEPAKQPKAPMTSQTLACSLWLWVAGALACLGMPTTAQASYFANCELTVIVKKRHKQKKARRIGSVKLTFRVKAIGRQSGHSSRHCTNRGMKGKTYTARVSFNRGQQKLVGALRSGKKLLLRYSYSDGMGRNGVVVSQSWRIKSPARPKKPKKRPIRVR